MFTPFLFGGIEFLVPLVLILLIVVLVARQGGNDRHGRRPYAIYLFLVSFISVITLLGAFGFLAAAIGNQATDSHIIGVGGEICSAQASSSSDFSQLENGQVVPLQPVQVCRPTGPSDAPVAIRAVLIAFVAGGVLWFHGTQARALLDKERADA
jgi:hypothetical protein